MILAVSCIVPAAGRADSTDPLPTTEVGAAYESVAGEVDVLTTQDSPVVVAGITTPTDPSDGIKIGSGPLAITVTPSASIADGNERQLPDGSSVYRGSDTNQSTVVDPTIDGVQIATVVGDDSGGAKQTFSYQLGLPEGASVSPTADGGLEIVASNGAVIATVDVPWAKDADGNSLPTEYAISGTTLRQTVNTSGANFPVVADPRVRRRGLLGLGGAKIWFTRRETENFWRKQHYAGLVTLGTTFACGALPAPLNAVCIFAVGYVTADFYTNLREAHARHHCLTLDIGLPKAIDWNDQDGKYCVHP